ncbi:Prolactin regulatory element-binding protein [Gryllus bimaculatus]|nr:Prolactin regulatory element-binding protein [Gryllus bimaculatus]
MPPTRRNEDGLLARVNFPLYTLKMLTSRHIIVAGGGGAANTGVANGFEIYELSHDGERYVAEEIVRHETGTSVVMNCASYSNGHKSYLVAGQESHCQLYSVNAKVVDEKKVLNSEEKDEHKELRARNVSSEKENSEEEKAGERKNSSSKRLKFEIKPSDSIQTDFCKDDPFQRVVRIGCSGKLMVTGGTDGHVRLWAFPSLKKLIDIAGHKKEIDDVDISPDEQTIVSLAKDGCGILWDVKSGKKIGELQWDTPENAKFLYKRCRFGVSEGRKSRLFTICNPIHRNTKLKSYIQLWDPIDVTLKRVAACNEFLSALSVSDDGKFVAIGTMSSGSVSVYIAFSLQRVLHVNSAHTMFVTGLEFLPSICEDSALSSCTETAVVSISVDNRICIHDLRYRKSAMVLFRIGLP